MAESKVYGKAQCKVLRWLLRWPLVAIVTHWVFQSIFIMGWSERAFKFFIDFILTIILWLIFRITIDDWWIWLFAFGLAHTTNFLLNGHLWAVLRFYGGVNQTYDNFSSYLKGLRERIRCEGSISKAFVCGSASRDEWTPSSDVDIRLLRNRGGRNMIRACLFALTERSRALMARFPLDLYVLDSPEATQKMPEKAVALGND